MEHFMYPQNPMNTFQNPLHIKRTYSNPTTNLKAGTSVKRERIYPYSIPCQNSYQTFYPNQMDTYQQVKTPNHNDMKQQDTSRNLPMKRFDPHAILGKQQEMKITPRLMDKGCDSRNFYGFSSSQESELGTQKQWPHTPHYALQTNFSNTSQLNFFRWKDTKQSLQPVRLSVMGQIHDHSKQTSKVKREANERRLVLTHDNYSVQAQCPRTNAKIRRTDNDKLLDNQHMVKASSSQISPEYLTNKTLSDSGGLDKIPTMRNHMGHPRHISSTSIAAHTLSSNVPQSTDNRLDLAFDYNSVEWSIKIVEHFIKLFQKEPNMANEESNLATLLGQPLTNDEMTMDKEAFDSLLFGNEMNMDTLPNDNRLQHIDSGFFEEQTVVSADTDFESAATSPFSSHFSNSPSSESGIEDGDDELDENSMAAMDLSRDAADLLTATTEALFQAPVSSTIDMNMQSVQTTTLTESLFQAPISSSVDMNMQPVQVVQPKTKSTVADAYEELKKLLYTVVSSPVQTSSSSAGLKTIMSETSGNTLATSPLLTVTIPTSNPSAIAGAVNAPVSTVGCDSSTTVQPSNQDTLVSSVADLANLTNVLNSHEETKSNSNPTSAKKARKGREKPKLVILDEPEENYRARYESEGCRGPIHGSSENTYPTIKVSGYSGPVWITVYLVTSSGQQHYHSIHGPGSTKVPCKEVMLPGGIPAVQLLVDPDSEMTAVLDSLSIRRLRNWEGDKELRKRGIDPRTWKRERKEARLLFQAEIPASDGQPEIKLTCKSRIFQCSSSGPTGNPEIWWTSRTEGSVEGNEEMGLIGKKFPSGCKVRFSVDLPSGEIWEKFVDVDKSKSHQGAAVMHTPPYCDLDILLPVTVNVEIVNGNNVKSGKCSEPVEFTYRPRKEIVTSMLTNGQNITMLGGTKNETQGGTSTTAPQTFCSSMANTVKSAPVSSVVPVASRQPDDNDWQNLCLQIKELQFNGVLNSEQIKKLCTFIQRRDLLLLQTFRSANNAGTQEERLTKLKQYLTGLVGNS